MSRWTPTALLVPVQSIQGQIDEVFLRAREDLLARVPESRVHHVGSTALAPALTRSIVDLELEVDDEQIDDAAAIVNARDFSHLPLATCVHVVGRSQKSERIQIRQTLAEYPLLLGEFIGMQKQHVHSLRRPYPQAKKEFFAALRHTSEFAKAIQSNALPYRIELETKRLRLESALACDALDFANFRVTNRNQIEAVGGPRPDSFYDLKTLELFLSESPIQCWQKSALTLLVRRKSDNTLIGVCNAYGFVWGAYQTCNLGYVVAKVAEGQGYMSEACALALDYLFSEWGIHRVQAVYDAENIRSAALAQRLGFQAEGTTRDYINLNGTWHDGVITSLVR